MIVDDHPGRPRRPPRHARRRSGLEVVGEASDGAEALRSSTRCGPTSSSWTSGCPASAARPRSGRSRSAEPPVLVLTTYDTDSDVVPALEAGATGYLLKDAPREELVRAIRAAARGESVLAPSVATRLVSQLRAPEHEALSDRELEVLDARRAGRDESWRRRPPLHQRGDREDAPAPHLREARRERSRRGGRHGVRAWAPRAA